MADKVVCCNYNIILYDCRIGDAGENWAKSLIELPKAGNVPMANLL